MNFKFLTIIVIFHTCKAQSGIISAIRGAEDIVGAARGASTATNLIKNGTAAGEAAKSASAGAKLIQEGSTISKTAKNSSNTFGTTLKAGLDSPMSQMSANVSMGATMGASPIITGVFGSRGINKSKASTEKYVKDSQNMISKLNAGTTAANKQIRGLTVRKAVNPVGKPKSLTSSTQRKIDSMTKK
jgi:hypothetical protein